MTATFRAALLLACCICIPRHGPTYVFTPPESAAQGVYCGIGAKPCWPAPEPQPQSQQERGQ